MAIRSPLSAGCGARVLMSRLKEQPWSQVTVPLPTGRTSVARGVVVHGEEAWCPHECGWGIVDSVSKRLKIEVERGASGWNAAFSNSAHSWTGIGCGHRCWKLRGPGSPRSSAINSTTALTSSFAFGRQRERAGLQPKVLLLLCAQRVRFTSQTENHRRLVRTAKTPWSHQMSLCGLRRGV